VSARRVVVDGYDLVIFDLDGVIYLGDQPIPGAPQAVAELRAAGMPVAYVTNNASRRAADVAALLASLDVPAAEPDVVTSAVAAARLLATSLPAGSPVLVVGAPSLAADLTDAGLRVVHQAADGPVAVVQGYGPKVGWADLAEACVAVRAGARWVATNTDRTLPSPRGPLPGNGSLVAALATALGRGPDLVVGKPEPALFVQAAQRSASHRPLVVGDRLDTDIEGARRAGMDSMLVLTGVSRPADLLAAPENRRPTYVANDLSGLFTVDATGDGWRVVDAGADPDADTFVLAGDGTPVAALRALCTAAWSRSSSTAPRVVPDGPAAAAALRELGLTASSA
jgi:glycerol-1-phosphatase